jgi:hypothetical protein
MLHQSFYLLPFSRHKSRKKTCRYTNDSFFFAIIHKYIRAGIISASLSLSLHLLSIYFIRFFLFLLLLPSPPQQYKCSLINISSPRFIHSSHRNGITKKKLDLVLFLPTITFTICQINIVKRKICV